jgi:prepilin-type N-terminal cleavage/methylation domain-containing protein
MVVKNKNNQKGFTLVEVMLSMFLMGIISFFLSDLAIKVFESSVKNESESAIAEIMSDVQYKLSLINVCNHNFAGKNRNTTSLEQILNPTTNKPILASGTQTNYNGFVVENLALSSDDAEKADLVISFKRKNLLSKSVQAFNRRIRIAITTDPTNSEKILQCSFTLDSVYSDMIDYACNGLGSVVNRNDPSDPFDDECYHAGYSKELCPPGERVLRYELVDVQESSGKIVPLFRPVCKSVGYPKSLNCPANQLIKGYDNKATVLTCAPVVLPDFGGYLNGSYKDCDNKSNVCYEKAIDTITGIESINLKCPAAPTTAVVAPSWKLSFATPAALSSTQYQLILKNASGTIVPLPTATQFKLTLAQHIGPCTGPENYSYSVENSTTHCNPQDTSTGFNQWSSNPRTCSFTGSQYVTNTTTVGLIGYLKSADQKTILAQTDCLVLPTPAAALPSPSFPPVPSPSPSVFPPVCQYPWNEVNYNTYANASCTGTVVGNGPFSLDGRTCKEIRGFYDNDSNSSKTHFSRYGYKTGNFDEVIKLDAVPQIAPITSPITARRGGNLIGDPMSYRGYNLSMFISEKNYGGNSAFFTRAGTTYYSLTTFQPISPVGCGVGAQFWDECVWTNTSPTYGGLSQDDCNYTPGSPMYFRFKRIGNSLSFGCSSSGPPTIFLKTIDISFCGMDTGLYLGAFLTVGDGYSNYFPTHVKRLINVREFTGTSPSTLNFSDGF